MNIFLVGRDSVEPADRFATRWLGSTESRPTKMISETNVGDVHENSNAEG